MSKRCNIVSARNWDGRKILIDFDCEEQIVVESDSKWRDWNYCPFCGGELRIDDE